MEQKLAELGFLLWDAGLEIQKLLFNHVVMALIWLEHFT